MTNWMTRICGREGVAAGDTYVSDEGESWHADQIDDYSSFMKNDYSTLKNTGTFQRALKDVKNITLAFVLELFNLN
jgi:hypothetical protein